MQKRFSVLIIVWIAASAGASHFVPVRCGALFIIPFHCLIAAGCLNTDSKEETPVARAVWVGVIIVGLCLFQSIIGFIAKVSVAIASL
jgi:hypothetical protein